MVKLSEETILGVLAGTVFWAVLSEWICPGAFFRDILWLLVEVQLGFYGVFEMWGLWTRLRRVRNDFTYTNYPKL